MWPWILSSPIGPCLCRLFAWQPDKIRGERERHERVVILKNLFSPEEFKARPEAILEYQQDLRDECGKCGPVRKVVLHDVSRSAPATGSADCRDTGLNGNTNFRFNMTFSTEIAISL